jgi:hypothetical protein
MHDAAATAAHADANSRYTDARSRHADTCSGYAYACTGYADACAGDTDTGNNSRSNDDADSRKHDAGAKWRLMYGSRVQH